MAAGAGGEVVVAAGAAAVAARPGDVAAGARRYCSASLEIRFHGQVLLQPAGFVLRLRRVVRAAVKHAELALVKCQMSAIGTKRTSHG